MNCFSSGCSVAILSRTSNFGVSPFWGDLISSERNNSKSNGIRSGFYLTGLHVSCCSSQRVTRSNAYEWKLAAKELKNAKDVAFFVVQKGDIVGIYKNLSDCQAQVGSSVGDSPVSVYKGYALLTKNKGYLLSCGLNNALYSINAADICEDIFGTLTPCPYQEPSSYEREICSVDLVGQHIQKVLGSETGSSCTIEFDGASKGNPGLAGAGVVMRAVDGNVICRLREGLGIETCNVAEYRALILGMRYALQNGITSIHVQGDSKLVCMQIQGLWKVRNKNMSILHSEAKKLKDSFSSFQIKHVLRDRNSQADTQANLAVNLAVGEVQEETQK